MPMTQRPAGCSAGPSTARLIIEPHSRSRSARRAPVAAKREAARAEQRPSQARPGHALKCARDSRLAFANSQLGRPAGCSRGARSETSGTYQVTLIWALLKWPSARALSLAVRLSGSLSLSLWLLVVPTAPLSLSLSLSLLLLLCILTKPAGRSVGRPKLIQSLSLNVFLVAADRPGVFVLEAWPNPASSNGRRRS